MSRSSTDRRLGRGRHYLADAVRRAALPTDQPSARQIQQAIWALVSRGLAYLDMSQSAPENWSLELTTAGAAVLRDERYNPDDPSGYLTDLYTAVPRLSAVAKVYIQDAVNSYYHQSYLASTVMLGVAAEAVFLDVAAAFATWIDGKTGQNLTRYLQDVKVAYIQRFEEFRKRLITASPQLPAQLSDGLDLQMNAVLDLLRANRNDAGHPTGIQLEREDCFVNLRIFARLAERMYALKSFFVGTA